MINGIKMSTNEIEKENSINKIELLNKFYGEIKSVIIKVKDEKGQETQNEIKNDIRKDGRKEIKKTSYIIPNEDTEEKKRGKKNKKRKKKKRKQKKNYLNMKVKYFQKNMRI